MRHEGKFVRECSMRREGMFARGDLQGHCRFQCANVGGVAIACALQVAGAPLAHFVRALVSGLFLPHTIITIVGGKYFCNISTKHGYSPTLLSRDFPFYHLSPHPPCLGPFFVT